MEIKQTLFSKLYLSSLSLSLFFFLQTLMDWQGDSAHYKCLLHLRLSTPVAQQIKPTEESKGKPWFWSCWSNMLNICPLCKSDYKDSTKYQTELQKNVGFELLKPTEQCEITPLWPQNMSVYHRGRRKILLLSHMTCQPRAQWAMRFNKIPLGDRSFTLISSVLQCCHH